MSNTMMKTATALTLTAGLLVVAAGSAEAGHRRHHGWGTGAAVAGGLIAGAVIGSVLAAPSYAAPAPMYMAPAPGYVAPAPVYYRPAPWTPEWYRYCSSRYRSFDPRTGYFRAHSGRHVFCQ